MTHITEHCEKNLLKQPLSIGRLIFADKYSLTELREVCLEYAKSTPLETVKRDELYDQVESGIKVEILEHNLRKMPKQVFQQIEQLAISSQNEICGICYRRAKSLRRIRDICAANKIPADS